MSFEKNTTGNKWLVFAFDLTDGTAVTGDATNITAKLRKDYGTATAVTDTNPTEIEDGYYEFDISQTESNADVLDLLPESSTGDVQVIGCPSRLFTRPTNFNALVVSSAGAADGLVQGFVDDTLTESTANRINENFETFFDNGDAATAQTVDDVGGGGGGGFSASVSSTADSGSSSTIVDATLTESDDHWLGHICRITSGSLNGATAVVVGFDAASDTLTLSPPLPSAVSTETYELWPAAALQAVQYYDGPTDAELDARTLSASELEQLRYRLGIDGTASAPSTATPTFVVDDSDFAAAFTEIKGAGWSSSTDTLEKIRDDAGGGAGFSSTELKQWRYRLGIDGDVEAPSTNSQNLGLNDLSSAAVETAVTNAITTYSVCTTGDVLDSDELEQLRYRLGIDGTATAPSTNNPNFVGDDSDFAAAFTEIKGGGWSSSTDTLEQIAATSGLDAAGVRAAIGMAAADLDDQLDAIANSLGSGANSVTITIDDGTDPLENATVRMAEGATVVVGQTDSSGEIEFSLDDATYDLTVTKPGYSFTPTTQAVSGTTTATHSMTLVSSAPPAAAGKSTGRTIVYDENNDPEEGVVISCQLKSGPGDDGSSLDTKVRTATSAATTGLVEFEDLLQGATYEFWRSSSTGRVSVTVPASSSFDIPEILGADE